MKRFAAVLCLLALACTPAIEIPQQHATAIQQAFEEAKVLYGISHDDVPLPNIRLADPGKMSYLCQETNRNCEVMAYFDNGTVVLDQNWSSDRPQEVGYLVHEFVHYFQFLENKVLEPGACVSNYAIEVEAYTIQSRWLEQKGLPNLSREEIDNSVLATLRC